MKRFLSFFTITFFAFLGSAMAQMPTSPCEPGMSKMDGGAQGEWVCSSTNTWTYQPISTLVWTQIGVANGVAPLGTDVKIDPKYLPTGLGGTGFTPQGAWSSGTTYSVGDLVSYAGGSYVSSQAGTNHQPDTATAYWTQIAAQGASGSGTGTVNTGLPLQFAYYATGGTAVSGTKAVPTGVVVGDSDAQTLTNKSIVATQLTGTIADARLSSNVSTALANFTAGAFTYDFSGAAHTKVNKSGLAASKPGTCTVSETYFATDATAGQNLFGCTSSNTWTLLGDGGAGGGLGDPGSNGILKRTALNTTAVVAAPTGALVGDTDTQSLTNKTVDGVTPATLAFLDATSSVQTQLNAKAALASPTFTGVPAAPTATGGTNTTQIATTAFVAAAVSGLSGSGLGDPGSNGLVKRTALNTTTSVTAPTGAIVGDTDTQTLTNKTVDGVTPTTIAFLDATSSVQTQLNAKSPLASPAFTGTPTAPTASGATNTTQVATTAFVQTAVSGVSGGSGLEGDVKVTVASSATGIAGAYTTIGSNPGRVLVPSTYPTTEGLPFRVNNIEGPVAGEGAAYATRADITYQDYRFGIVQQNANANGPQGTSGNYRSWLRNDYIASASNPLTSLNYLSRANTVLTFTALAGGVNENVPYNKNKSFYYTEAKHMWGLTRGQKIGDWNIVNCPGVGDCAGYYARVISHGTFQGNSDEGTEGINAQVLESQTQPYGTIASISGSTATLSSVNASGEIGEGRYLVDITSPTTGNITAMANTGGSVKLDTTANLRLSISNTLTASSINTSITSTDPLIAGTPITITVASASGISNGTIVTLSSPEHYEKLPASSVSGNTFSVTPRYTYTNSDVIYVTNQAKSMVCIDADSATDTTFHDYLVAGNIDSSYPKPFCLPVIRNGTNYIDVWLTGPNTGYEGYHGRWNSSTRAGYHLYNGLEIVSVKHATLDQVSNTITLETATSGFYTAGDSFVVPDYHSVIYTGSYFVAQKLLPSTNGATSGTFAFQMNGVWDDRDTAISVNNLAPQDLYVNQGMTRPNAMQFSGFGNLIKIIPSDCTNTTKSTFCAPGYIIHDTNKANQPIMFKLTSAATLAVFQADGGSGDRWNWTNYNNAENAWVNMLHPRFGSDLHTPTSSSEACVTGTFWDDATYHYSCTATNTIKRIAYSTF